MSVTRLIEEIQTTLCQTFKAVDNWFDKPEIIREFAPQNGGWTINQILEHISLTNHYLLILIDKGATKALKSTDDLSIVLENYQFEREKLDEIGLHKSFAWICPEHMEPKGEKSLPKVRQLLSEQLNRCQGVLNTMPNGEGLLYKTSMSVNDLGKINVYEYIYFLAKHAQRHITQMSKNESGYDAYFENLTPEERAMSKNKEAPTLTTRNNTRK